MYNARNHVKEDVDMLKAIWQFFVPLVIVAAVILAGFYVVPYLKRIDNQTLAAVKIQASTQAAEDLSGAVTESASAYPWLRHPYDAANTIAARVPAPTGYERVQVDPDGFANWLRNLPLKPAGSQVCTAIGQPRQLQAGHVAVLDIDAGTGSLQQSVQAVMRLRAEYLYHKKRLAAIYFKFPNGQPVEFIKWAQGIKPVVGADGALVLTTDGKLTWTKPGRNLRKDYSYENFRAYLDMVFAHVDAASYIKELEKGPLLKNMSICNVFITAGKPGQAAIAVDMAERRANGAKAFLLVQGANPAQDLYVTKNFRPADTGIYPWFDVRIGQGVTTPEGYKFTKDDLKKLK
jgi:hypothetical protein